MARHTLRSERPLRQSRRGDASRRSPPPVHPCSLNDGLDLTDLVPAVIGVSHVWYALKPATVGTEHRRPVDLQRDRVSALVQEVDARPVVSVRNGRSVARVWIGVCATQAFVVRKAG